jgi:hypothetical protein
MNCQTGFATFSFNETRGGTHYLSVIIPFRGILRNSSEIFSKLTSAFRHTLVTLRRKRLIQLRDIHHEQYLQHPIVRV